MHNTSYLKFINDTSPHPVLGVELARSSALGALGWWLFSFSFFFRIQIKGPNAVFFFTAQQEILKKCQPSPRTLIVISIASISLIWNWSLFLLNHFLKKLYIKTWISMQFLVASDLVVLEKILFFRLNFPPVFT